MSLHIPMKLLEINIISAKDLPPVSKLLRTYAAAWVQPDHKLTTRIDHHGHTNPTWNYKMVFPLNHIFLKPETSTLTIQVYNVMSLRDIPIGTATILINNIQKNSRTRPLALQVCRPSGLLQGTLNVGVYFIDTTNQSMPLSNLGVPTQNQLAMSAYTTQNDDPIHNNSQKDGSQKEENAKFKLERSRSEQTTYNNEDFLLSRDGPILNRSKSGSIVSVMRPLPSEVAVALRKGLYSTAGDDFGSSIFDNWTVAGDPSDDGMVSKEVTWQGKNDQLPLIKDFVDQRPKLNRRKKSNRGGGGLLSCFGNANGFEISFICGNNAKKNRKKTLRHPHEKLPRLYT